MLKSSLSLPCCCHGLQEKQEDQTEKLSEDSSGTPINSSMSPQDDSSGLRKVCQMHILTCSKFDALGSSFLRDGSRLWIDCRLLCINLKSLFASQTERLITVRSESKSLSICLPSNVNFGDHLLSCLLFSFNYRLKWLWAAATGS